MWLQVIARGGPFTIDVGTKGEAIVHCKRAPDHTAATKTVSSPAAVTGAPMHSSSSTIPFADVVSKGAPLQVEQQSPPVSSPAPAVAAVQPAGALPARPNVQLDVTTVAHSITPVLGAVVVSPPSPPPQLLFAPSSQPPALPKPLSPPRPPVLPSPPSPRVMTEPAQQPSQHVNYPALPPPAGGAGRPPAADSSQVRGDTTDTPAADVSAIPFKFIQMKKMNLPAGAIRQKMTLEGFDASVIDGFLGPEEAPPASASLSPRPRPMPPKPPAPSSKDNSSVSGTAAAPKPVPAAASGTTPKSNTTTLPVLPATVAMDISMCISTLRSVQPVTKLVDLICALDGNALNGTDGIDLLCKHALSETAAAPYRVCLGLMKLLVLSDCDDSVRKKDWRCCKRGTQAT
jgi:hypothetical protein